MKFERLPTHRVPKIVTQAIRCLDWKKIYSLVDGSLWPAQLLNPSEKYTRFENDFERILAPRLELRMQVRLSSVKEFKYKLKWCGKDYDFIANEIADTFMDKYYWFRDDSWTQITNFKEIRQENYYHDPTYPSWKAAVNELLSIVGFANNDIVCFVSEHKKGKYFCLLFLNNKEERGLYCWWYYNSWC